MDIKFNVDRYIYYVLIGVISLTVLVFLPMLGSEVGLGTAFPDTAVGWSIWIVVKLIVAGVNILMFDCFIKQGKLNIKNNPAFKEAQEKEFGMSKETAPRSPKKYLTATYGKKGATIFICSVLGCFVLTQAILTFDYTALISYSITILLGLVFGIVQMKSTEIYWTEEYPLYVYLKGDKK